MIMLRSGVPLTRAIEFLSLQTKNKYFASILKQLITDLSKGVNFSDSLARWPKIFGLFFTNMIKASEAVGILDEALEILAEQLEKSKNLRSKIIEAIIYPVIILGLMVGISLFLVFFVFPQIINLYNSIDVKLPLLTSIFLVIITFLTKYAIYLFAVFFGAFAAVLMAVKFTKKGSRAFDWVILHTPVFGNISQKLNTALFARNITSLLKGGVALPQALEITAKTLSNSYFEELCVKSAQDVRRGEKLSASFGKSESDVFPLLVIQMIGVGEETGSLNKLLVHLTEFYEEETRTVIASLTTMIEPILMIIIGVGVAFIAISTVQLLYSFLQTPG